MNVNIVVSTYAVLYDALCHAFVSMESLALIVFDEG
jgi:ERCC4-related helicase